MLLRIHTLLFSIMVVVLGITTTIEIITSRSKINMGSEFFVMNKNSWHWTY